ncbi:MAG: helix-turn-helix domain-containing protein [Nitrososphaerales archaeon]
MAAWEQKRRDTLTLEERRIKGVRMIVEEGLSEHQIANRLDVSQEAVSKLYIAYRKKNNSLDALKSKKHLGRPSRLNRRQMKDIPKILKNGATHYGFSTDLWTAERVGEVMERKYHIEYSSSQVARILHSLNQSWKKPDGEAREFDEEKVRGWVQNMLPEIKKS